MSLTETASRAGECGTNGGDSMKDDYFARVLR